MGDGGRIRLRRPAPANWGIDFVVEVVDSEGVRAPSQANLAVDVGVKLDADPTVACTLYTLLDDLYRGEQPSVAAATYAGPETMPGWSIERLAHVAYWLFLEQDVTYWASSGRRMLMEGLRNEFRRRFEPDAIVHLPGGRFAAS